MDTPLSTDQDQASPAEHDVVAIVAMLDYLIAETSRFDAMSAHCLALARKSLIEAVPAAFARPH
jgi:hypothetical protein